MGTRGLGAFVFDVIIQKISMLRYQNYTVITRKNVGFAKTGLEMSPLYPLIFAGKDCHPNAVRLNGSAIIVSTFFEPSRLTSAPRPVIRFPYVPSG